jgi:hypothetical protein
VGAGDPAADDDPTDDPDAEHPGSTAATPRDAAAMTATFASTRWRRPILEHPTAVRVPITTWTPRGRVALLE